MRVLKTPSSVNSLYTPLGSIDSLPPPYFPRLSGESNPVFGEQKRLSTNWSASSALRLSTYWSARTMNCLLLPRAWTLAPLGEYGKVLLLYVSRLGGYGCGVLIVRECYESYASLLESLFGYGETVGV